MTLYAVLICFIVWNFCSAQVQAATAFECNFKRNACGLVNDDHHEARWTRKYMSLGGQSGMVMVTEAGGSQEKQMARMTTPIIDEHWHKVEGCLSLDLFTSGDGVTSFRVKKQDGSGVASLLGVRTQMTKWRTYNLHVSVDDYIRFIFEADLNPSLGGTTVAISNISFTLEDCKD